MEYQITDHPDHTSLGGTAAPVDPDNPQWPGLVERSPEDRIAYLQNKLTEAVIEWGKWRRLFTALVVETAGISSPDDLPRTVQIAFQSTLIESLVLVEWPVVEFSYDFSVFREGEQPTP